MTAAAVPAITTDAPFSDAALSRIIRALIADEWGAQRGRPVPHADTLAWTDAMGVDEDEGGLGVDSLARLAVVSRVNQFFHLHETGVEDYLLVRRRLGDWTELVGESLKRAGDRLTFLTSGSTGTPKPVTHRLADLRQEAAAQAEILPDSTRIIAFVPPHHIYGCLTTALLADHRNASVFDARSWTPSRLAREIQPSDLLIATPFHWQAIARDLAAMGRDAPLRGAAGVTSTAPLPAETADGLAELGLDSLTEFYGSSETAGVGWRRDLRGPFTLFEHWTRVGDDDLARNAASSDASQPVSAPDHLSWIDERRFTPAGRRDGAVQVGGVNVFPSRVRDVLRQSPLVADAAVRLDTAQDARPARLKAFVVLKSESALTEEDADAALRDHCRAHLSAAERPARMRFGPALPRTEMGKLADWA